MKSETGLITATGLEIKRLRLVSPVLEDSRRSRNGFPEAAARDKDFGFAFRPRLMQWSSAKHAMAKTGTDLIMMK
jgi:hypothetical protein